MPILHRCFVGFLALNAFLLTLWRFGANQMLILAALMVLFYRPWRIQLWDRSTWRSPLWIGILLLVSFAALRLIGTQALPFSKGLDTLNAYFKLFFLILLPIGMRSRIGGGRFCIEQAFIFGVLLNVILSTLFYFHAFNPFFSHLFAAAFLQGMNATFSINPLQLIFVVIVALWILALRLLNQPTHFLNLLLFLLLTAYLWFINIERSGYLLFLVLLLFLLWHTVNRKMFLSAVVLIPILFFAAYSGIPQMKARIDLGVQNVVSFYHAPDIEHIGPDNSLGLRLAFAAESLQVIQMHPVIGTGLGSFPTVYQQRFHQGGGTVHINDPHNMYTYVSFELGLIGLFLYLLFLVLLYQTIQRGEPTHRLLLTGLFWAWVVMGLTDTTILLNAVMGSFILIFSISQSP